MPRYAVHEGFISSKNDGDRHFISFTQLCRLYGLSPLVTVDWVRSRGLKFDDYVHLYPNYDGDYSLPAQSEKEATK